METNTMLMDTVHCKISYDGQIRRFVLDNTEFTSLKETIARLLSVNDEFVLKYLDDESDYVTLDNQEALETALGISPEILRLLVEMKNSVDMTSCDWQSNMYRKRGKLHKERMNRKDRPHFDSKKKENRKLREEKKKFALLQELQQEEKERQSTTETEPITTQPILGKKEDMDLQALDWTQISHFYVDGNNLFYVFDCLRKATLKRNIKLVETVLAKLTKEFGILQNIKNSCIVLDQPRINLTTEQSDLGLAFSICGAAPFRISDDKLVAMVSEDPVAAKSSLIITADRELRERLKGCGARIGGPKTWMEYAAQLLGKDKDYDTNQWLKQYSNL